MECYKEVLVELERVEQKMENQSMSSSSSSSEGLGVTAVSGTGRSRVGSSGRSTLQAIGSAAAAGFIFSISVHHQICCNCFIVYCILLRFGKDLRQNACEVLV